MSLSLEVAGLSYEPTSDSGAQALSPSATFSLAFASPGAKRAGRVGITHLSAYWALEWGEGGQSLRACPRAPHSWCPTGVVEGCVEPGAVKGG